MKNKFRKLFFAAMMINLTLFSCGSNFKNSKPVIDAEHNVPVVRFLSDYLPSLKDTPVDAVVYILDSGFPGAALLLAAGSHGNEIAGIHAADVFAASVQVERGRVFVIPRLSIPGVAAGSRLIPVEYQNYHDPEWFIPPDGRTRYPGFEQRNINRSYPGSEHEGAAQKIAMAVMNLLISEKIDIAIDMHEASPLSGLAWTIIANPKNADVAALAVFDLEEKGISMLLETSPSNMDGLSHKEWGSRTGAMAFLIETANPSQAGSLLTDEMNRLGYALDRRVKIQLEAVRAIVSRANEVLDAPLIFTGIP